jgi:hypothetical protein
MGARRNTNLLASIVIGVFAVLLASTYVYGLRRRSRA